MSFEWKCGTCGADIIVPYESPKKMSMYATALCPKCFKEYDRCEITGEEYEAETEVKNITCKCYRDVDGIIIECKKEKNYYE